MRSIQYTQRLKSTHLIPRFMVSAVPIIEIASNILLQILAAYKKKATVIWYAVFEPWYKKYLPRSACVIHTGSPESPTFLKNVLYHVLQIFLYLAALECNKTSDWMNQYGLANQKFCYIQIYNHGEKGNECSCEWLVNTDPGLKLFVLGQFSMLLHLKGLYSETCVRDHLC